MPIDRNITGRITEINHVDVWDSAGAFSASPTGNDVFSGTAKGTNYGNRDICMAIFNANADVADYENPTAGHTDIFLHPHSIYALPLIAY